MNYICLYTVYFIYEVGISMFLSTRDLITQASIFLSKIPEYEIEFWGCHIKADAICYIGSCL